MGARTGLGPSVVVALALVATGCGGSEPAADPPPRLGAEIVQLRRDEVLRRVEVAVTNRTGEQVTVESIDLRVPGFGGGGVQRKDEPLPPARWSTCPRRTARCAAPTTARPGSVGRWS